MAGKETWSTVEEWTQEVGENTGMSNRSTFPNSGHDRPTPVSTSPFALIPITLYSH